MKNKNLLVGLLLLGALTLSVSLAEAQGPKPTPPKPKAPTANAGTAFTYQGQVKRNSALVNGICNFNFGLWDASTVGNQVGVTQTVSSVSVTNGLFATPINFGSDAFTGDARWLQIQVQCTGDGSYTTLNPREALTPAPIALSLPGLHTQQNGTSPNLIGGYQGNVVTPGHVGATIGGGGALTYANWVEGDYATIGGGESNSIHANFSTIGGGVGNTAATGLYGTIGGGVGNLTLDDYATVNGGWGNTASGEASFVGGGIGNEAAGDGAVVGGGGFDGTTLRGNKAFGVASTIGGGITNVITSTAAYAFIGGGRKNSASGVDATISGGAVNKAGGPESTVGGGANNTANGENGTVGGGFLNMANGAGSFVGGGGYDGSFWEGNHATGGGSTVAGGLGNQAMGYASFVGGGGGFYPIGTSTTVVSNTASGNWSTVAGGTKNVASGAGAIIPGGNGNVAGGENSFATGTQAKANHNGAFVWGDDNYSDVASTGANQFVARSVGGFYLWTNTGLSTGCSIAAGGGTWSCTSDRNMKENFSDVKARDILARVDALPIQTWNYKTQDASIRHIGPMAQDFYAAFNVGEDDRHITMIDSEGVALAAIQGLDQLVKEQEDQIAGQQKQIEQLRQQNAKLEMRLTAVENAMAASNNPVAASPEPGVNSMLLLGGLIVVGLVAMGRRR